MKPIATDNKMRRLCAAVFVGIACVAFAADGGVDWPVARRFDGDHILRVALPMGGIGCGSVSLSGRGDLVDWEVMNRANKTMGEYGLGSDVRTFFAIRVKGARHESTTMLAGPLHPTELYESEGCYVTLGGLPRFRNASFEGAFPFGTVHLEDRDLPVKVRIRGFSPFVPGDSEASSLPVASLEYEVENLSGEPLDGRERQPHGFSQGRGNRRRDVFFRRRGDELSSVGDTCAFHVRQ